MTKEEEKKYKRDYFRSIILLKEIEFFDGEETPIKMKVINKLLLNFDFKPNSFGALVYNKNGDAICCAGKCDRALASINEDYELEKLIDSYFDGTKKLLKQNLLKQVLLRPLFRKKELRYYKSIESSLKNVLYNFPHEIVLESIFLSSRWAKTEINGKNVVVGVVFKNKKPHKIGVGFPSVNKGQQILKQKFGTLKFYAATKTKKLGYYLNFKDATTGRENFD